MTTTNYPVGDFLIRVKNVVLKKAKVVTLKNSNMIKGVAEALKRLGFLDNVSVKEGKLEVLLTYKNKEPLLSNITLVSKPGLRVYKDADFFQEYKGPSFFIVSTSKGILTSPEARKENAGGEVIAEVV